MTVYHRGKNRTFYYDFTVDGVRYKRRVGPDRRDALRAEQVARARALQGRLEREWGLGGTRARTPTVGAFIEREFLPELARTLAPSSVERVRYTLRFLADAFGPVALSRLSAPALVAFRNRRLASVGARQVRNDWYWLRRLIRAARHRRYLGHDPSDGIPLPRPKAREYRLLARGEEAALFGAFRPPVARAMVRLMLLTGLRRGEACRLQGRHVELGAARLTYVQPKTGRQTSVPLVPEAVALLRPFAPAEADALVFTLHGRAVNPKWLSTEFARAARAAGLTGLRLHDVRHTVATRLIQAGWDKATVGSILGHRPPYRQTDLYTAHTDEARKRAALERAAGRDSP